VRIGQPHLKIVAIIAVGIGAERRRVPDIVLPIWHPGVSHIRSAGAADAEIHLCRIVPDRDCLLAGFEHAEHHANAGGETITGSRGAGMNEHRLAPPACRAWERSQAFNFGRNLLAADNDRLPQIERSGRDGAADVANDRLCHAAVSCFAMLEMRGMASPGGGMARPVAEASARRRSSIPSETSEMPIPIGLNSEISACAGRGRPAATISQMRCTLVQSPLRWPSYQSMNSALSERVAGSVSTATSVARGNKS